MTAQSTDTFIYKRQDHELIGLKGAGLFSPDDFGMIPEILHTACYRGFICTYKTVRNRLYLHELVIREANGNYRPINGVPPEKQYVEEVSKMIGPEGGGEHEDQVYTATYHVGISCQIFQLSETGSEHAHCGESGSSCGG